MNITNAIITIFDVSPNNVHDLLSDFGFGSFGISSPSTSVNEVGSNVGSRVGLIVGLSDGAVEGYRRGTIATRGEYCETEVETLGSMQTLGGMETMGRMTRGRAGTDVMLEDIYQEECKEAVNDHHDVNIQMPMIPVPNASLGEEDTMTVTTMTVTGGATSHCGESEMSHFSHDGDV